MKRLDLSVIEKGFLSDDSFANIAAINACRVHKYDASLGAKWWETGDLNYRIGECYLHRAYNAPLKHIEVIVDEFSKRSINLQLMISMKIIQKLLVIGYHTGAVLYSYYPPEVFKSYYSTELLKRAASSVPLSTHSIRNAMRSNDFILNTFGLYQIACLGEYDYLDEIMVFLDASDKDVQEAAINALRAVRVAPMTIHAQYSKSDTIYGRINWMKIAKGRTEVTLPLSPNDMDVTELPYISGLKVPFDQIEKWSNGTEKERTAAAYALVEEPHPPFLYINRALEDDSPLVKNAALVLAGKNNYPPIKDVDVHGTVYKKCINDVIIEAKIPHDASIRGEKHGECRSSKAFISNIEGSFFGDPVGIAFFDCCTQYRIGDMVSIKGFDYSRDECVPGFHFFCDKKMAKKYHF